MFGLAYSNSGRRYILPEMLSSMREWSGTEATSPVTSYTYGSSSSIDSTAACVNG
jgi:hypothetical protein